MGLLPAGCLRDPALEGLLQPVFVGRWRRLGEHPSTLLDVPVKISEYSPSVLTNSAYVGILGNFSYYEICDVEEMEIQRLVELFAGNHEVGFLGRRWLDGAPVLGEAFTRLILHS